MEASKYALGFKDPGISELFTRLGKHASAKKNYISFEVNHSRAPLRIAKSVFEALVTVMPSTTVWEIPCLLDNGPPFAALGDMCAKYNSLREDVAFTRDFKVDRNRTETIVLNKALNLSVTTTGVAHVDLRFSGERSLHQLEFHLLRDCVQEVTLGRKFLNLTQTFTRHFARVRQRVVQGLAEFHLLYLGDSGPKFTSMLNGRPQEALGDIGANGLIMDEACAHRNGIPVVRDEKYRRLISFADGTTKMTSGIAFGVSWGYGLGAVGKKHLLDFHILENAPADVILSDDFLFNTKAFTEYNCYLVEDDDESDEAEAYFHVIRVDEGQAVQVSSSGRLCERNRRDREDSRIQNLPLLERPHARVNEDARRTAWDTQHARVPAPTSAGGGSMHSVSPKAPPPATSSGAVSSTIPSVMLSTSSSNVSVTSPVNSPNTGPPISQLSIPEATTATLTVQPSAPPIPQSLPQTSTPLQAPSSSPNRFQRFKLRLKRKSQ
ncbi:hypothetical protein T440DRAFT_209393 [Plenodomus tracheiphilus IPT5]|uniref:Uncharacterized protein n=1 Tax=Plenodomus tracheiphilus IPT5 TaxID=1408161 RepID=A0A6A7BIU6_9PLEO|nr:hypothetical protein T440DRAFT_209393 [Plenodomus tracheiphilus IPT5]